MYLPPIIEWLLIQLLWFVLKVILIVGISLLLVNFVSLNTLRFRRFGIPQPLEPPVFGYGGINFFIKQHINDFVLKIYRLANGAKYIGFHVFSAPMIAICDPDLVKDVLVTHFDHFTDHYQIYIDNPWYPSWYPVLAHNPIFANNPKWGKIHNKFHPIFTLKRMRNMYSLMSQCAGDFVEQFLHLIYTEHVEAIDMKEVFSRYVSDAIAKCFIGIEVSSLREPANEFYAVGKRFTDRTRGWWILKYMMIGFWNLISFEDTRFYALEIISAIRMREENVDRQPDVLQQLMDAHGDTSDMVMADTMKMTDPVLMCFLSGLETTSVQMCLIAHELATHPKVQTKLQEEIDRTLRRHNGNLTYNIVNNMKYLNAVLNETLRLHPGTGMVTRMCTKNYVLPPVTKSASHYCVRKGEGIIIPVAAIHRDPKIYDDPDTFRPERFLGAGHKRAAKSDPTILSFGLGPRVCLGNKFAVMVMKVMFVYLLARSTLMPCAETCIPLVYDTNDFNPAAKDGFWLRIKKRKTKMRYNDVFLSNRGFSE